MMTTGTIKVPSEVLTFLLLNLGGLPCSINTLPITKFENTISTSKRGQLMSF